MTPTPPPKSPGFYINSTYRNLFLGNGKWLFHLDHTTFRNDDVLQRPVAAIGLRFLNLLHHILKDKRIIVSIC